LDMILSVGIDFVFLKALDDEMDFVIEYWIS
jgi:hypothetical protein